MKTLMLTIADDTYAKIEADARLHGRSVEEEIAERCQPIDWAKRPLITDRDELQRAVEEFHRDLGRNVIQSAEELEAAINQGRE